MKTLPIKVSKNIIIAETEKYSQPMSKAIKALASEPSISPTLPISTATIKTAKTAISTFETALLFFF